ncbi:ABC transporter substrate-binding protein [Paucibacter sp. KBW04]|uniref:substrate-binding periplasmic protein n=1 Tax=Paucibacter sp. KBW04 TaxID=2153361 RepID=UPI000F567D89|nr:transporter substrate-binding domain-containing protein [Paucibacter sp. KBW04]RQO62475.1 ABC transporter substrate-binding protein [Paucibacter sp. KBW04]
MRKPCSRPVKQHRTFARRLGEALLLACALPTLPALAATAAAPEAGGAPLAATSTPTQLLHLVTEEYPPYNMSGQTKEGMGEVTGISSRILQTLLAEAKLDYTVAIYPWARAIAMARSQAMTCVYSMSRTPERESLYQWVGPLVFNDWTLFARSGGSRPAQLQEAIKARIGSYRGDAIVPYLQERGYQVDVGSSDELNPRKLLAGRIDFWATGRLIGLYRLQQQGLTGIEPVLNFNRSEMYLACQKDMPEALIRQLNQGLQALDRRGVIRKIYSDFGYTP